MEISTALKNIETVLPLLSLTLAQHQALIESLNVIKKELAKLQPQELAVVK